MSKNFDLKKNAKIGNFLASKIIQKIGARFDDAEIKKIKKELCQFGI